ncbi:MAG: hypothetical protein WA860_02790 [Acidimicrobiales bacterium]
MVHVLFNEDVQAQLDAPTTVQWISEAVDAHHRGELVAPPRAIVELSGGQYMFTAGRLRGSWFGFRSDDSFDFEPGNQVVIVQDETSGVVRAIAIGDEIGPRRVGAIGAVAVDTLASSNATTMALIGTGVQAASQLWAIDSVRNLRDVRVFSRNESKREEFVRNNQHLTSARCRPTANVHDAVRDAEIVILATTSLTPVLNADWLSPGAYVATLGPKRRNGSEVGIDLLDRATSIVTDSLEQMDAFEPPSMFEGSPHRSRLVSLGAVRAGEVPRSSPEPLTLFVSVGLAGTEAFLLDRLVRPN